MTNFAKPPLSAGTCAALACMLEVAAPKPGNVHRGADFEDLSMIDLLASGIAIAAPLDAAAAGARLGPTVLAAIEATRGVVSTNTNLGMVLLMAPLAMAPPEESLTAGVRHVLATLDADDARCVYQAIRLAQPGGMGKVDEADLAGEAPASLLAAMQLAAERDLVARQYVNHFAEVLQFVVPQLTRGQARGWPLADSIVRAHLELMADHPDSLIARKCGANVARQASDHARQVLDSGWPGEEVYARALGDFDFWLRSDGHRRNPGATADLVAAGLFAALRDGIIQLPLQFYQV